LKLDNGIRLEAAEMRRAEISSRIKQIPASAIHEMNRLARGMDDVILLSWARPTADTPDHIKEAAIKAIRDGLVGGYSEHKGIDELREEITRKLLAYNRIEAETSQVMVTVGAMEGLAAALAALTDPGDEVILPSPTYSAHISQVLLAGAVPVFAPLVEEESFSLDLDAIRQAITSKTKVIYFCSPSNPTGAVFSEEELMGLAEIALNQGLMVLTDEAYEYFVYDGRRHFSIASLPEMRGRVVSCFTFTKTYAMTGWRVGYLHADEALIKQIAKAHIPLALCAPVVSQYAALAALKGPQECVEKFRGKYLHARDLICRRLDGLPGVFSYSRPAGGYLIFPRILSEEGSDSTAFALRLLREAKVSFTPGVEFGPGGEGHLRMSFCVPEGEIDLAFDRLEDLFIS
jgi:aminotransferase